jgi:hypothetical protein
MLFPLQRQLRFYGDEEPGGSPFGGRGGLRRARKDKQKTSGGLGTKTAAGA